MAGLTLALAVAFVSYGLYHMTQRFWLPYFSPLRNIPGPPNPSLLLGNFKEMANADLAIAQERWVETYGRTIVYKGVMNSDRLLTVDLKALKHILTQTDIYEKPGFTRGAITRTFGDGLLAAEGGKHQRQRRIMNPAFGPSQIRSFTGVLVGKAIELRDKWENICRSDHRQTETASQRELVRIDVLAWLQRMTLDIVGMAGFGYAFESLSDKENELAKAFTSVFGSAGKPGTWDFLYRWIPLLRSVMPLTERERQTKYALETIKKIGVRLFSEKKQAIQSKTATNEDTIGDRDLLTLLIRANMATELPKAQLLDDQDVIAQIPTFVVAGNDTVASAISWALHALALDQGLQSRLREELRSVALPSIAPGQALSSEIFSTITSLPLLDAVVRETLRLQAPTPNTFRMATRDDVIPLDEPFVGKDGLSHHSIRISKGDVIFIPILMVNRLKSVWGEDALEFKPERWLSPSEDRPSVPGVWSNLLTFLSGPHACIGYRFAIAEIKIVLHVLITSFKFEPAVPQEDIGRSAAIIQRPFVRSEREKGNQLPLLVTRVEQGLS